MASNQRLRKARRKVHKLTEATERWKHDKNKLTAIQTLLHALLPRLAQYEYMKRRVKEARIRRRRMCLGGC